MACPITKTLRVLFTAPQPVPSSGYRIKWRVVGASTYTTAVGPFLSSPATITNVPSCEDIEGTIESSCGGIFSAVVTFTATKEQSFVCGSNFSDSSSSPTFIIYPKKLIDLQGSTDIITINYDAVDLPNRFNIYNSANALIVNSGWRGTAAYSGPWGSSLNTSPSGTMSFNKSTSGGDQRWYYLTVEHGGNTNTTDAWNVSIACSAPVIPTYAVTPSVTSVNEGGTVTFTVNTTNVANGTTLYYTTAGTATAGDFSDNNISGSVTINSNTGTITRTISSDSTTEGAENFTLSIRTQSTAGTVVATSTTVTINDTSTTPVVSPTYAISPNVTSVNEGGSVTFTVNTTNVANGTVLYYTSSGIATAGDFSDNTTSGTVTINSNTGSIIRTIVNDNTTEGGEYFTLSLRTGSTGGTVVATAAMVTINDTSTTPVASPTYSIVPNITSVNEGGSVTFTVSTSNVADGTILYWVTNASSGLVAADFTGGALSGQVTINGNTGSIVRSIVSDTTTEGTETFSLALKTGSTSGPTVATSATVSINDTSTTPASGIYYDATRCDNGFIDVLFSDNPNIYSSGTVLQNYQGVCYVINNVSSATEANAGYIAGSLYTSCNECLGGAPN